MSKQAPLTWLRSFESSARHASFTRAAEELSITQAAVSKQMKALESQLGCQLFKRHAHGLSLTEQGRRYWLDTRELIQQLDNVTTHFLTGQQSNKIHIRCNISYSALVLSSQLKTFAQHHSKYSIELTHNVWEPHNSSRNAHIEIGYGPIDKQAKRELSHLLSTDYLFPVASPELDDESLAKLPLIHVSGYYHEWDWWREQVSESQNPDQDIGDMSFILDRSLRSRGQSDWMVDNSLVAYQLAEQGLGIALGRSSLVRFHLARTCLKPLGEENQIVSPEGFYISLTDLGRQQEGVRRLYNHLLPMGSKRL